jgi:hypothetical protein
VSACEGGQRAWEVSDYVVMRCDGPLGVAGDGARSGCMKRGSSCRNQPRSLCLTSLDENFTSIEFCQALCFCQEAVL